MQFTSIVAVLSMALAATALPNALPNETPAPAPVCSQSTANACCNASGGLLGLSCLIPLIDCDLNGGKLACCPVTQTGLINLNAGCIQAL